MINTGIKIGRFDKVVLAHNPTGGVDYKLIPTPSILELDRDEETTGYTSGHCISVFGDWVDIGETKELVGDFTVARDGDNNLIIKSHPLRNVINRHGKPVLQDVSTKYAETFVKLRNVRGIKGDEII